MKPILYRKILTSIKRHDIKTITLNLFDTVLLNEYWPTELRHYDLSVKQLPLIQSSINSEITAYELYDLRRYAKQLLLSHGRTLTLDLWLTEILELLLTKCPTQLTNDQQLELLANLIKIELEFTIENCKPNQPLIAQLQLIKQQYPSIKFYFTSHSHFTPDQIKIFLQIFQIDLFDGSIDNSYSNLPPTFQVTNNLHIGDSHTQDFLFPKSLGSQALHYRPIRMRGLRTIIGQAWINILQQVNLRHLLPPTTDLPWQEYSHLTSAYQKACQHQLTNIVNLDYNNYISNVRLINIQQTCPNLKSIPELDHDTIIRAFIWLLANFSSPRWDAPHLLELIIKYTDITSRAELYDFCFRSDYIYSHLAIESFSQTEFYQTFLDEIKTADQDATIALRQAYEIAILALPQNHKPVTFITTKDDWTFELFHEFARLHNISNDFEKLILDNVNDDFLDALKAAGNDDIQYHLAPDTYLTKVLTPRLKKLTKQLYS